MIDIKNTKGNITKVYANIFENEAFVQIKDLSNFEPYLDSKIRIMPDAHAGKGCTVGTTMTIKDKVSPSLVGVDIGCGVLVCKLSANIIDLQQLDNIIKTCVPSGFDTHQNSKYTFDVSELRCLKYINASKVNSSVGTLGGGNHFIELDIDENNSPYLVIHSGSRNLGVQVCNYYQNLAFSKSQKTDSIINKIISEYKAQNRASEISEAIKNIKKPVVKKELAYLTGSDFDDYIHDMRIVQQYASENRRRISEIILDNLNISATEIFETIHNYIDFDRMILRKGAVRAEQNEKLIIPINMKDGSLICLGKGNEDWNYSAPHGAGRLMSRSKAKDNISLDEFKQSMCNIYSTSVCESTIDEAPQAYKPMEDIVSSIQDTVNIVSIIKPIYNYKAH